MAKNIIYQANAITQARYELSALQKNILYLVMAQIKKDDAIDKKYRVSVADMERILDNQIRPDDIRKATASLVTKLIEVENPDGETGFLQMTFFSSVSYIQKSRTIELEISQRLKPYLFDLKEKFTTFQLDMALTVKSKYSKRLYEMLSQYKDTKKMFIKVEDLKYKLFILDEKGGDTYPNWADFEKRILKTAQKELDEHTDIAFTYKTKKTGRKVTSLEFFISKKHIKAASLILPEIETLSNEQLLARLTSQFKLRKDQALKILELYPEQEINKRLYEINLLVINKQISSIGGYTAKIFGV